MKDCMEIRKIYVRMTVANNVHKQVGSLFLKCNSHMETHITIPKQVAAVLRVYLSKPGF